MSWTHLRDITYKARKLHRCFLCNGWIIIGDTYIYRVGKDDEGISVIKMHPECEKETHGWDDTDWECFGQGDMERPDASHPFPLGCPALPE